jgi:energy-converting hydrogenase Eha subunit E
MSFQLLTQWIRMKILKVNGMFLHLEIFDIVLTVLFCYFDDFFILLTFLKRNNIVTAVVTLRLP